MNKNREVFEFLADLSNDMMVSVLEKNTNIKLTGTVLGIWNYISDNQDKEYEIIL